MPMLILFPFIIIIGLYLWVFAKFRKDIYNISTIPEANTLLVLGAGVVENNLPSLILEDRLISTFEYSKKYNPHMIIVSGTKTSSGYDEPTAMRRYLLSKGISERMIEKDNYGHSTFQSLLNLKMSGHSKSILVISQRFHLPRSLMICKLLKIEAIGLAADNIHFSQLKRVYWNLREVIAIPYNLIKLFAYFFMK